MSAGEVVRLHSVFPRHEPKFGRVLDRHPSKVLAEQIEEPCSCRLAVRVYAVLGVGVARLEIRRRHNQLDGATVLGTTLSYSTIVHVRGEVVRVQLLHVVAGTKPCQLHQVVDEVTELAGVVGGRVVAYPVASRDMRRCGTLNAKL